MIRRSKHSLFVVGLLAIAALTLGFSSGPPDGRTGAPGESNCTVGCHGSFALNSGPGTLTISSLQTMYQTGDSLFINIDLSHTSQMRWGFEMTALDSNNNSAGELLVLDPNTTQKSVFGGREYIKHTSTGTFAGTPDASIGWTIRWIANNGIQGPVTFYAAGNAANNNGFNTGDFIYTTSLAIPADPIQPSCCIGLTGNIDNDPGDNTDIGDLTKLIDFLFISGVPPVCMEEANTDGDPGGNVDIGDLTKLIDFLFISGTPTAACLTP